MSDVLKDELDAIAKSAADDHAKGSDFLAEAARQTSHPFVVADLAAANIHRWMAVIQDKLTAAILGSPTVLLHPQSGVVVLQRNTRLVAMSHSIGDYRVHFGWAVGTSVNPLMRAVDARLLQDPSAIVKAMMGYLTCKVDALFVDAPSIDPPSPTAR